MKTKRWFRRYSGTQAGVKRSHPQSWHRRRVVDVRRFFQNQGYKVLYEDQQTPLPDLILYSEEQPHIIFVEVEQLKRLDFEKEKKLLKILDQVREGVLFTYLGREEISNIFKPEILIKAEAVL